MPEPIQALLVLFGVCFVAMLIGGSFAFGVATVCRWTKWAPVNTIINIQKFTTDSDVATPSASPSAMSEEGGK